MCAYGFVNEPMYCLWKDEVPIYETLCQDCTDCVIKQVIEKCKYCYDEVDKENDGFYSILQLFDIEEIIK